MALLEASLVREFQVGSEAEACVADDDVGALYISEEDVGLWRYGAEPNSGATRTLVDAVQPTGHIAADTEGVTVVDLGTTDGYVIASAQNTDDPLNSYFVVFRRETNAFVGTFRIVDGGAVDGCSRTDGITAYAGNLGPDFPQGVFICQDDQNTSPAGRQNFKLVRLEKVVDLAPSENQPPSASFVVACQLLVCDFDASASGDVDGSISSYAWDFGDGTTGSGRTIRHTYPGDGNYLARLTVTDDDTSQASTTRQVLVASQPANAISFVAAATTNANRTSHQVRIPTGVQAGDTLLLMMATNANSTLSNPAGWSLLRSIDNSSAQGRVWSRTATAADAGALVTVTSSVFVKSDLTVAAYRGTASTPIAASAIAVSVNAGSSHPTPVVTLSQAGGTLVNYWADKSGDGTALTPSATPTGTHTTRSTSNGSGGGRITALLTDYTPTTTGTNGALTATGTPNSINTITATIALAAGGQPSENQPPSASFVVACQLLVCDFDASASGDVDGSISSYAWDFGDGTTGSGRTIRHTYPGDGNYLARLTVTDDDTSQASTTRQVLVASQPANAISFVAAATTNANRTSHQVRIPTGVQAGDTLLLMMATNANSTLSNPAGWSLLRSIDNSSAQGRVWSRTATAADAGALVTVTSSVFVKSDLTVAAYRGTASTPIAASAIAVSVNAGSSHPTPVVTLSQAGGTLVNYWADKSGDGTALTPSATPTGTHTTRSTSNGSGGGRITALLTDYTPTTTGTNGALTATGTPNSINTITATIALRQP